MPHTDQLKSLIAVTPLNGEAPTPLYYQLYQLLKGAILNGTFDTGSKMPTEQELAAAYDVSRITAKRALDELAAEELIDRRRGKGSHVIHKYSPQPVKAPLIGMLQEIESMARHSDVTVLSCLYDTPPTSITKAMNDSTGAQMLHTVRVRSKDGVPFGYYDSWTRDLASDISGEMLSQKPRLEIFRENGLNITHVSQTISAVNADARLAAALKTDPGTALISLTRFSYVNPGDERMVDYLQLYYHPERFQYRMDLKVD